MGKKRNTAIAVAVITGIFGIITALINILPALLYQTSAEIDTDRPHDEQIDTDRPHDEQIDRERLRDEQKTPLQNSEMPAEYKTPLREDTPEAETVSFSKQPREVIIIKMLEFEDLDDLQNIKRTVEELLAEYRMPIKERRSSRKSCLLKVYSTDDMLDELIDHLRMSLEEIEVNITITRRTVTITPGF